MSKAYHDRLRAQGEADFKAGKPITAFYKLPLKRHKELDRGRYELGWRDAWHEAQNAGRSSVQPMSTSDEKITKALEFANCYGGIDGDHHKMWVIDQMVRALTGCPMDKFTGTDVRGQSYEFEGQGTNDEYSAWIRDHCAGEDGPETYSWDVGIPP